MKKNKEWKITRYNRGGKKLLDFQKNDKEKDLYSSVKYITENINGDICTTDFDASKILVVTSSGQYRFSYSGSSNDYVFHPCGICTDVLGNILVCNGCSESLEKSLIVDPFKSEFGIHLLDQDGRFLSLLLKHPSSPNPRALCFDNQNNLMVGSKNSPTVTVYKYLPRKGTL
ncbi:uncharacterized protein LOC133186205 [Saccostrea echinata]|uniref:uncharacterized protein LOC133186205 n=1 Tax=Saccostrea echinata TaxID=191078 RepID=UPI002A81C552|nr:uncharacterized protein LOC133186205 [Saccostrea echinata]